MQTAKAKPPAVNWRQNEDVGGRANLRFNCITVILGCQGRPIGHIAAVQLGPLRRWTHER